MGKINVIWITIITILFLSSCKSQTGKMKDDNYNSQLEEKLIEIAHDYVKMLREETKDDELFCIYVERGNDENNNFYKYLFYDSVILSENLDLPYQYINREAEENFVVFFFDEEKKVPDDIKGNLEKDSLWTSLSNIDRVKKYRPVIKMSHNPVWDVFICKGDISKYEIIKSIYGLEEKDKVTEICK